MYFHSFSSKLLMMRLKSVFLFLVVPVVLWGQSAVTFQIRNMGSTVEGSFEKFTFDIRWNPSNPAASVVAGKVMVESIKTGISLRDSHLRSSSFFHASKYPEIVFKSSKIERAADGTYVIIGQLSLKNVTKEHSFLLTINPDGRRVYTTTLNRRDFNVGGWSLTMGDEVQVSVVE